MNLPRTLWRLLFVVLLLGLILAAADLLITTLSVVLLIFAGILFGIFLNALSRWLSRHTPLSYRWAYALVVLLLVGLAAGGFYYLGSQVAEQVSQLSAQLQSAGDRLTEQLQQYGWTWSAAEVRNWVSQGGTAVVPNVIQGLQWLMWGVTGLAVIFFVGLYVAYDPDLYETGLVKLVPRPRRDRAREVLGELRVALGKWMIGRIISMSTIGILTALGLWLLGVPLPISLGVLAALLTFIPNIGPILAAIPQALLAFQVGTDTVLYVILFNLVLQGVESYMVTPIVQRYEVTLPPALTIFVQLLMAVIVGVIGIVMAAPLTVTLMVLIQLLYIRDKLGDPEPGELTAG